MIIIHQPQNPDGKPTPMCVFDPTNRYLHGHMFRNMTSDIPLHWAGDRIVTDPLIVCTRCGARWEVVS